MINVDSRVRLTTKGKGWFCDADEPGPEHVLATVIAYNPNEKDCYKLQFDDPQYGKLYPYADRRDVEEWPYDSNNSSLL